MKLFNGDYIALGFGAVIISTFSFLFYFDITNKVEVGAAEVVGNIKYKRNTAQRKYSSQVVWENIERDEILYNNDSIRTADLSEAVIYLKDGTEIALNENSMIMLALSKDQISVDFSHGSMLALRDGASGKQKLNIKSGKTTISLKNSNVKLSQNKGKDLNLSVSKGNAEISAGSGAKVVNTDERVIVTKDAKEFEVEKLKLKLVNPIPNSYFLVASKKKRINFSWEPVKGKLLLFIEMSRDNTFDKTIVKKKVKQNFTNIMLQEGIYYWRIKSVNTITKKIDLSDSRRLTVLRDEPVILFSPRDRAAVAYRTSLPIINFKWSKSEIAKGYDLILSREKAMTNILHTFKALDNSFAVDSLTQGTYFWRVEKVFGISADSPVRSSKIYKLIIDKKELVEPPELIYPVNNKNISKVLIEKRRVAFSWKKNFEIIKSKYYIAKDENFENIVYSSTSNQNFLQFNENLPLGRYFWRVVGVLEGEEETAPSLARAFHVIKTEILELISPKVNSILTPKGDDKYANVRFTWKRTDIDGRYSLQVSKNQNFKKIFKESLVDKYSESLSDIKPGRYYWKVSLIDNDGTELIKSNPRAILVKDRLDKPDVIFPHNKDIVNMSDRDELTFTWKGLKGANVYSINLFQIKNNIKYQIMRRKTKKTNIRFGELSKLAEGKFFWTLQAFDKDNSTHKIIRESPMIKTDFVITLGKRMKKPKVRTLKILTLE
ncbi:MAG: FecR domain-containing protein [Spirochaetota bacterium]|nr:FecR domain-containing protein [Spirochaetota bacterium]